MSKLFYFLILATASVELASSQSISCYDCDPHNFASDCPDPVTSVARTTNCVPDSTIVNGTSICLSAFVNVTGTNSNSSGIYRGCYTLGPAVANFCDLFREEKQGPNITVVSCETCNTSRCNIVGFRDDGTSGSNNILTFSAFALVFNAILVITLSGKE